MNIFALLIEKTIQKWNFKKHRYEPHKVNPSWNVVLYSENMDLMINCTNCGKKIKFGDRLTSKQYHNNFGIGYPVCEGCYQIEREKLKKFPIDD